MIGAGTTLAELERDDQIPAALREACRLAASPQLRNAGSLGGNLLQSTRCWYWRLKWPCRLHGGDECLAQEGEHREHAIFANDFCASAHPSDVAAALLALGRDAAHEPARAARSPSCIAFRRRTTGGRRRSSRASCCSPSNCRRRSDRSTSRRWSESAGRSRSSESRRRGRGKPRASRSQASPRCRGSSTGASTRPHRCHATPTRSSRPSARQTGRRGARRWLDFRTDDAADSSAARAHRPRRLARIVGVRRRLQAVRLPGDDDRRERLRPGQGAVDRCEKRAEADREARSRQDLRRDDS